MKIKRIIYTVQGSGEFPFDMLRYDASWPRHESESRSLEADYGAPRQVTLTSDSPNSPNVRRWESFAWRVVSITDEHGDPLTTRELGARRLQDWLSNETDHLHW